jgi:hypothetical protein
MLKEVREMLNESYAIHAVTCNCFRCFAAQTFSFFLHMHARMYTLVCGPFQHGEGVVSAFILALLDETCELTIVSIFCGDV